MSNQVSKNVVINMVGRGWGALLSIALTPIYIRSLGVEAYGLIGIFVTLQILISIFDMGLGTAANREMAVLSAQENSKDQMRDFLRTLERIYWATAVCIALLIAIFAKIIANMWIKPIALQVNEITIAVIIMGVALATQWPSSLYSGALMGLQKQLPLNYFNIVFSTIRALGAVFVLSNISSSVVGFFAWQAIITLTQTVVLAIYTWRGVALKAHNPKYSKKIIKDIRKFATEMSVISLMAVALTQLDKVILSRVLTLESFGYYYVASVAAGGLYIIISPIFSAIFPKFTQLLSSGEVDKVSVLYEQASQLMAVLVLPIMMVMVFFSRDLLLIWTHNESTAENGYAVLALLSVGNALNGLMNVPYALQLASGNARSVMKLNGILLTVSIPAIIFLAKSLGGFGAGVAWIGYTLVFLLINMRIIVKSFIYINIYRMIWNGILQPTLIAFVITYLGYELLQSIESGGLLFRLFFIILTAIAGMAATTAMSPQLTRYLKGLR